MEAQMEHLLEPKHLDVTDGIALQIGKSNTRIHRWPNGKLSRLALWNLPMNLDA